MTILYVHNGAQVTADQLPEGAERVTVDEWFAAGKGVRPDDDPPPVRRRKTK